MDSSGGTKTIQHSDVHRAINGEFGWEGFIMNAAKKNKKKNFTFLQILLKQVLARVHVVPFVAP